MQHSTRRTLLLAYLGAGITLTGTQAILPALPAMQQALQITDQSISLVITAYLVPSVVLAFPSGVLADMIGRRKIYVAALLLFGVAGAPLLVIHSFWFLIAMRVLQGVAFAAMLPLSVTMIGDVREGASNVRAQGHRVAVMLVFEAGLTVVGGLMAAWFWYAPFGLQLVALPMALLGWRWLPPDGQDRVQEPAYFRQVRSIFALRGMWSLQLVGFSRFLFKFAVLTYFPILAVSSVGLSEIDVGLLLGLMGLSGTVSAVLAGRVVERTGITVTVMVAMGSGGVALITIGVAPYVTAIAAAMSVFGFADGLLGIMQNSLASTVGPESTRGGFVAMTSMIRNLGKLLAPVTLAGVGIFLPLGQAFVVMGVLALCTVLALRSIRSLEAGV